MELKKTLSLAGAVATMAVIGCVSIDQNVQVTPPSAVEQYGRSPIDQCTPHTVPHHLIMATAGIGVSLVQLGGGYVPDQTTFDFFWGQISPQLDQSQVISSNLKPVIDWNVEGAYFVVVPMSDSCTKAKPYGDGITSDCYTISIPIYLYEEDDCQKQPVNTNVVLLYIYPKNPNNLPTNLQWIHPTPTPTLTPTSTPLPAPTPPPKSGNE